MSDEQASPSERDVRAAIVDRYGARARAALGAAGAEPAADACCAPGETPGAAALEFVDLGDDAATGAACDPNDPDCDAGAPDDEARFGTVNYDADRELATLPESVVGASAGCGNPVAIAELRPGDSVLDLGSGGGIDCFLAARQVGEAGEVWGLDMTPDMVALARHNAETMNATNVRFRLGEIEDIPFEDDRFDVIMSNCVINLSTDKPQVFREALRVLKPGGRLRVSDMVWTRPVSEDERGGLESWAGCVAGALHVDEYIEAILAAGFVDVTAEHAGSESGLVSAYVSAVKPA